MAVPVNKNDIVFGHPAEKDDLVRSGCAVCYKICLIGAKDLRCVSLRFAHRPGMVQQRSQFADRYREVRTEELLPEEIVEHTPGRGLHERSAAGMARGMPGIFEIF